MLKLSTVSWLAVLAIAAPAAAQGTRADFERAARLEARSRGTVVGERLRPNWIGDGPRFWYRADRPGGSRDYLMVDPEAAARGPAFDHARLADSLARALGAEVRADRLDLEGLEFPADAGAFTFRAGGKSWRCDPKSYDLDEIAAPEAAPSSLATASRASRRTGEPVVLTIVNRTAGPIALTWLDTESGRHDYGRVAADEESRRPTFAGHVWSIADGSGRELLRVETPDRDERVVIDGRSVTARERPARRGPRGGPRSPDGRIEATVRDHDVILRESSEAEEIRLTDDGTADDPYVPRFSWSPDSSKLVVIRKRPAEPHPISLVESSPRDRVQPRVQTINYLKPGDRIAHPRPRLFDVAGRRALPIDETLFLNPWSLTDVRWAPDSSHFTFLYNERGHQALRIVAVDAATGEARAIIDERSPTFVDYSQKTFVEYLDDTGEILWMSERSGWNHLYLIDAATGDVKNSVTSGEWVVRAVDRVDREARQVWFRAMGVVPGQDPYHVHFARVGLDGSGLTLLTEGDGTHDLQFSTDRRFYVDRYSRVDLPPIHELRRASDGSLVLALERADASALLANGWRAPERFVAKGRDGETDIWGLIFRPTNFDEHATYPVIEQIYAGPHGAHVPKDFAPFRRPQALAELGFLVVQIDGMGTNWRSKAFHDVCWKNLKDAGFPDRVAWMKAAAADRPQMDLKRMGIFGGSAGGQNAMGALLFHGDFYKAAAADCGCHDNRMDKIWWNEAWMGWPVGPEYADSSNVTHAHRLTGKLLLTVGELDRNVDPASTMQVANALIRANKDFELIVFPGAGHGIGSGPYGVRRRDDFFVRHLMGVEPRAR